MQSRTKCLFYDSANLQSRKKCSFYENANLQSRTRCLFYESANLQSRKKCLFYENANLQSRTKSLFYENANLQSRTKCLFYESANLQSRKKCLFYENAILQSRTKCLFHANVNLQSRTKCLFYESANLQSRKKCLFYENANLQSRTKCLYENANLQSRTKCLFYESANLQSHKTGGNKREPKATSKNRTIGSSSTVAVCDVGENFPFDASFRDTRRIEHTHTQAATWTVHWLDNEISASPIVRLPQVSEPFFCFFLQALLDGFSVSPWRAQRVSSRENRPRARTKTEIRQTRRHEKRWQKQLSRYMAIFRIMANLI